MVKPNPLSYIPIKSFTKAIHFTVFLALTVLVQGCGKHDANSQESTFQDSAIDNYDESDNGVEFDNDDESNGKLNVVAPDWGIAATLTAMGYPPIATGDIRVWDQWVGEPKLPNSVTDLGIRYQPNAELVAQLPVDMVIDNYFYAHARNLYGDVPAESVLFASENKEANWNDYVRPTEQLGQFIHQPNAADTYITESHTQIEQAGQRIHQRYPDINKFAVVQFVDANNMRMYAKNSLFNVVFTLMGFEFEALEDGNMWGFAPIQLGDLARLEDDVCLLVIEPLSPLTEYELKKSLVWQRLGYGLATDGNRCMAKLKPVWIYGGMSSLTVLADNLASTKLTGGKVK